MRLRLDLAYAGTNFKGWAIQPGLRTVQGVLQDALNKVFRAENLSVTVAGRTDAGVHARGQVVHVEVSQDTFATLPGRSNRSPHRALSDRLFALLPDDITVFQVQTAAAGFDARFSALWRRYSYRIADLGEVPGAHGGLRFDPLHAGHVLWVRENLNVSAMNEAMASLIGLNDFAAYCKKRPESTTIRQLQEMSWQRAVSGPDAGLIVARVRADAFCHNMVRSLVGASLAVGTGKKPVSWPYEMLQARVRDPGIKVVSPRGLVLEEVAYPSDDLLLERANRIRARRSEEDLAPASECEC